MSHDTKLNLHQRLHAVMGEVDYIQKERKQGMRYTIVSHDAVTAKVRPILHKHGVVYYPARIDCGQTGNRTEMNMAIRFVNVDDPADAIEVATAGYGIDDQDKGPGKAISYGVKYALLKVLGLETGDDPDLDQDTRHDPKKEPPQRPGPKSVERGTPLAEAHREITNGTASTAPQGRPAAAQPSAKDWANSDEAKAWLSQAKTEINAINDARDIRAWQDANAASMNALDDHNVKRHGWLMDVINARLDYITNLRPAA